MRRRWTADEITRLLKEAVSRGQKLSHYRGQIEPPASLPGGATVGCFGEVMSERR